MHTFGGRETGATCEPSEFENPFPPRRVPQGGRPAPVAPTRIHGMSDLLVEDRKLGRGFEPQVPEPCAFPNDPRYGFGERTLGGDEPRRLPGE